jgi:hypothetical protein
LSRQKDLVARDEQGKPYTVRYEAVNAMLLNEFLKEHRKVKQLEDTVARQNAHCFDASPRLPVQLMRFLRVKTETSQAERLLSEF